MKLKYYPMSVISFKHLDWTDLVANIVDISRTGVGIEVQAQMEPGFVWFYDHVDGQKGGLLLWSRRQGQGGIYRGGVKFVPLSPESAQRVQENIEGLGPLRDASDVINAITESMQKTMEKPVDNGSPGIQRDS